MNIRKSIDYKGLFAALDKAIAAQMPQVELYCEIGHLLCARAEKGAAVAAAAYLTEKYPGQSGFSARNVRRMRNFYRMYENIPKLLLQALHLSWTQNVVIVEADLTMDERAWYLQAAKQFDWSKLTLQKKISEATHLTDSIDSTPGMCCAEQDGSATITSAPNDRDRKQPLRLAGQYRREKYPEFAMPVRRWHMGRESPDSKFYNPFLCRVQSTRSCEAVCDMEKSLSREGVDNPKPPVRVLGIPLGKSELRQLQKMSIYIYSCA